MSGTPWEIPERIRQIDDLNRDDHAYLKRADECYFLYEYTAGEGRQAGEIDRLIHDLKKKPGDRGYRYKAESIAHCAAAFSETLTADWVAAVALIPIPPSRIAADLDYDDRISRICRGIRQPGRLDVRELIEQIRSTGTFHEGQRRRPAELRANYRFNEEYLEELPAIVAVVDDMLTTGSHFRAVKDMILERAPDCRVIGLFVARRTLPDPYQEVLQQGPAKK